MASVVLVLYVFFDVELFIGIWYKAQSTVLRAWMLIFGNFVSRSKVSTCGTAGNVDKKKIHHTFVSGA